MKSKSILLSLIILATCALFYWISPRFSIADDIQSKISNKNSELQTLNQAINELGNNINSVVNQKNSLQTELNRIEATSRDLQTTINSIQKQIVISNKNIKNLETQIINSTNRIDLNQKSLADSMKSLSLYDSLNFPEIILSGNSFSNMWNDLFALEKLQNDVSVHIDQLTKDKNDLEANRALLLTQKKKLGASVSELADEKKIADDNIKQKNDLIRKTKNKESNYRKLLADTEARKEQVQNELTEYESELRITIEPSTLPAVGSHILHWPLSNVRITQYFGDTTFSRLNYQIYNGHGHNGIDLGAGIGTPLLAAEDGTVVGIGNTDSVCYGASYGKWIMIDHHNGLETIYGHLSLIKVSPGDSVLTGDLIGYTGKTGYATGPHLHFTVAASAGVKIGQLKSKIEGCGTYTIPLGPLNAYLNPLWYI